MYRGIPKETMNGMILEIFDIDLPMREALVTAKQRISRRSGQEIHLTHEGHTGKGEVLPLPLWSKVSDLETKEELQGIQSNPEEFLMRAQSLSLEVQAGMTSAIWAQKAALLDEPLWSVLGGTSDQVLVNALIGGGTESEFRNSLEKALNDGYGTIKVKMGFPEDKRRLKIVSEHVASETKVRLDANCSWTLREAVEMTRLAEKLFRHHLEYVEDPVTTIDQLHQVRADLPVPVATDALTPDMNAIEQVISMGVVDNVILKPLLLGGIDAVLALSKTARDAGIDPVISSTFDGPVGLTSWCHLASAIGPNTTHGLGTAALIDDKRMKPLIPRNGVIKLRS